MRLEGHEGVRATLEGHEGVRATEGGHREGPYRGWAIEGPWGGKGGRGDKHQSDSVGFLDLWTFYGPTHYFSTIFPLFFHYFSTSFHYFSTMDPLFFHYFSTMDPPLWTHYGPTIFPLFFH